jgi:hypothetical protein
MPRTDIGTHLGKIDALVREVDELVPSGSYRTTQFRADLAGLLAVTIAATYETCVKETLIGHAGQHHRAFGEFASRHYKKINSRIREKDLVVYCKLFGDDIHNSFKISINKRKDRIKKFTGQNISDNYENLLNWRHEFAHSWSRITTMEEVYRTHRIGSHVILAFNEAFHV